MLHLLLAKAVTLVVELLSAFDIMYFFYVLQALGCLLLEMCVLQYAFNAGSLISLFCKIVKVDHAVRRRHSGITSHLIKEKSFLCYGNAEHIYILCLTVQLINTN